MKNERILSFSKAKELSADEIESVSAGNWTGSITPYPTHDPHGGMDIGTDGSIDC